MKRRSASSVRERLRTLRKTLAEARRKGFTSAELFKPAPHAQPRRKPLTFTFKRYEVTDFHGRTVAYHVRTELVRDAITGNTRTGQALPNLPGPANRHERRKQAAQLRRFGRVFLKVA